MKKINKLLKIYIVFFFICFNIMADDSEKIKLEEIVISATRSPSQLSKVSALGSVISQNQISRSAANNVGELLESADFVQILDYGPGSLSLVSLRGASGSQVLVLLDGERINNVQNGYADLDKISLDNISRIEIIRGGQSALYGADAAGGIINIITENSYNNKIELNSEIGSFGYLLWNASIKRKLKKLLGSISFSQSESDGDFEFKDKFDEIKTRENADFIKRNVLAKIKWQPRKSTDMIILGRYSFSDCGDPGPLGQYSPDGFVKEITNSVEIKLNEQIKNNWKFESNFFGNKLRQHYFNPNGLIKIDDIHKVKTIGGKLQSQFFFDKNLPLTSGISIREERLSSSSAGEQSRASIGFYIQQEIKLSYYQQTFSIFPALRYDKYSDFDAGLSPKLGMLIQLFGGKVSIKSNIGCSYRAPTMNDLYWPEDAFAKGNPFLEPEESEDFDLGIELKSPKINGLARVNYGLAYFHNNFKNRIEWAPGKSGKWSPINLSEAQIRGVETSLNLSMDFFRIGGSYTFLKAHDSLNRQLIYRPQHSLNYHIYLSQNDLFYLDELWFQIEGRYQSKRYYTRENTKWLESFIIHDFKIGTTREVTEQLDLKAILELQNLFDVDYQLQADYPLPGRHWRAKFTLVRSL